MRTKYYSQENIKNINSIIFNKNNSTAEVLNKLRQKYYLKLASTFDNISSMLDLDSVILYQVTKPDSNHMAYFVVLYK
jgi:hypothetical protein